jgi:hypothetical protein
VACSSRDVLSDPAPLAVDDALRVAVLFSDTKELPNLETAALDEVFAVGVLVQSQVNGLLMKDAATMKADQTTDRGLDLQEPGACAVIGRKMKQQMAVFDVRSTAGLPRAPTRRQTRFRDGLATCPIPRESWRRACHWGHRRRR